METVTTNFEIFKWIFENEEYVMNTANSAGTIMFCARDVCALLELENVSQVLSRLGGKKDAIHSMDSTGRRQKMTYIDEECLFELVFASRKIIAKQFQKYVLGTILPTIWRTGEFKLRDELKEKEDEIDNLKKRRVMRPKEGQVKLSSQLISLGYLKLHWLHNIYSTNYGIDSRTEHIVLQSHPDKSKFTTRLLHVSKLIAKHKTTLDAKGPDIVTGAKRTNFYTSNDYENFGNKIIEDYMERCGAPEYWNIDWEFSVDHLGGEAL